MLFALLPYYIFYIKSLTYIPLWGWCAEVHSIAELLNRNAETFVLQGGEDYELLFSVPPALEDAIGDLSEATSVPLTRIGMITDSGRIEDRAGRPLEPKGWDPFSES